MKNRPDEGRASGKHYSMPVPSEQTLGAVRAPLPDLPRRQPRSPREIIRKALFQLAWAHSEAVAISAPAGASPQWRGQ